VRQRRVRGGCPDSLLATDDAISLN